MRTGRGTVQRVPVLVLDDGTIIAESIAICRYFEALNPEPALFGAAAASFLLLFIGIHNAWDAITYVAVVLRQEQRDTPEDLS